MHLLFGTNASVFDCPLSVTTLRTQDHKEAVLLHRIAWKLSMSRSAIISEALHRYESPQTSERVVMLDVHCFRLLYNIFTQKTFAYDKNHSNLYYTLCRCRIGSGGMPGIVNEVWLSSVSDLFIFDCHVSIANSL